MVSKRDDISNLGIPSRVVGIKRKSAQKNNPKSFIDLEDYNAEDDEIDSDEENNEIEDENGAEEDFPKNTQRYHQGKGKIASIRFLSPPPLSHIF